MSGIKIKKRKIAILTGTRAEYGLLYWLMRHIEKDPELELQIIATAMHLSPEFGLTYQLIEEDGFTLNAKIEMLLSSDTAVGITKSIGVCLISMADTLHQLSPDILVILGDRFESLAVAQAALVQNIPVAHIHGGELSEGAIDDAIRHAITKMSHLHFVAAEPYRKRVIQLGENPDHVFNVGAPGLERIARMKLLLKDELEKRIGFTLGNKLNFLITYHPATLSLNENTKVLQALFAALDYFPDSQLIFTKANADTAGRYINSQIDDYVSRHQHHAKAYVTMGELNYLSLLQYVDAMIGNSSSGIIEAPYFHLPTINIGNRQAKRLRASTIIDCEAESKMIIQAITIALSRKFQDQLNAPTLFYTQDNSAEKMAAHLKTADLEKLLIKHFHEVTQ
jgi:UDP-hydrolysing UDP-N-acetyl-D-glucosamine 2-epimerase